MTEQEQMQILSLFTRFAEQAGKELKALREEVETLKTDMEELRLRVRMTEYSLHPPED